MRPSLGIENVALAAHRLQIDGIGGVVLDLAPEPVDLHVDGALAAIVAVLGELVAGDGHGGALGEIAEELPLALGEANRLAVALELAAADVEDEIAHAHLAGGGRIGSAAKHVADPEQQLSGIEGFGEIIVDAG